MQAIGSGVEDDGACPDSLELAHNKRMGEELLCLSANGNLESRDARRTRPLSGPISAAWGHVAASRHGQALQGIEIIGERINQLTGGKLLEQPHGQQLAYQGTGLANPHVARILLALLLELQTVCEQAVKQSARELVGAKLLLDGLDEEL